MRWLLKLKVWRIESALRALLKAVGIKPFVWSFGAYYIDPKHMVFVVGVPSDKERDSLRNDKDFLAKMQSLLVRFNWPAPAREHVAFDIESQETVDRESNGNWWHHYKNRTLNVEVQ